MGKTHQISCEEEEEDQSRGELGRTDIREKEAGEAGKQETKRWGGD